ncbi:MAG: sirohydrochlorin chelatase, partial [Mycobacterium leprae]
MSHPAGLSRPVLVAAAHGTRDPRGRAVVGRLCERVRAARPDLEVRTAWVDVGVPSLAEVLAQVSTPSVVVPLLLSTGYHVRVDLPRAAAAAGGPTT